MARPGDFFVGVTDLFSVLLPGAVLTFLAMRAEQSQGSLDLFGLLQLREGAGYAAFLVTSYLLGHLVDMIGASLLDHVYDILYADYQRWPDGLLSWLRATPKRLRTRIQDSYNLNFHGRKPPRRADGFADPVYAAARSIAVQKPADDRLYQWCRDWLQLHNSQALQEPDRLQANSKFFRGFVVVAFCAGLFWLAAPFRPQGRAWSFHDLLWAASCLMVTVFSFLRYSDLRWKAVQHVYRLYVIGRSSEASGISVVNIQPGLERQIGAGSVPGAE